MVKSIFITNQFKTGGVETVFLNIARNTEEEIYLFPIHNNRDDYLMSGLPSNVHLIRNKYRIPRNIFGLVKAIYVALVYRQILDAKKFRVINFSDTLTTLLMALILNPNNCVSWIHCNPLALLQAKTYKLYWWLLHKCKNIIFISESQRKLFFEMPESSSIDFKKSKVCLNFIDFGQINRKKNEKLDYKGKFFLTVARLDLRSKDYKTLIKGYSLLPSSVRKEYKLLIAGDGEDREKVEEFIDEFNQEGNIILLGNVDNPYKYMARATLYIHSSISEGFSMSIIEALACGCTVVASNCKVGPSEILENGKYGYLYNPGDYKTLEKKIEKSLENPIDSNIAIDRAKSITKLGRMQIKEFLENNG